MSDAAGIDEGEWLSAGTFSSDMQVKHCAVGAILTAAGEHNAVLTGVVAARVMEHAQSHDDVWRTVALIAPHGFTAEEYAEYLVGTLNATRLGKTGKLSYLWYPRSDTNKFSNITCNRFVVATVSDTRWNEGDVVLTSVLHNRKTYTLKVFANAPEFFGATKKAYQPKIKARGEAVEDSAQAQAQAQTQTPVSAQAQAQAQAQSQTPVSAQAQATTTDPVSPSISARIDSPDTPYAPAPAPASVSALKHLPPCSPVPMPMDEYEYDPEILRGDDIHDMHDLHEKQATFFNIHGRGYSPAVPARNSYGHHHHSPPPPLPPSPPPLPLAPAYTHGFMQCLDAWAKLLVAYHRLPRISVTDFPYIPSWGVLERITASVKRRCVDAPFLLTPLSAFMTDTERGGTEAFIALALMAGPPTPYRVQPPPPPQAGGRGVSSGGRR